MTDTPNTTPPVTPTPVSERKPGSLSRMFNSAARGASVAGLWTGEMVKAFFGNKIARRWGIGGMLLLSTAWSSVVMVNDNERGVIGGVHVMTQTRVVEPGSINFKIPYLEDATIFRTGGASLRLDDAQAITADDQRINFALAVHYHVPAEQVPTLARIAPDFSVRLEDITRARLQSLVGGINAAELAAGHGALRDKLEAGVGADIARLYGVEMRHLEIPAINPDEGYLARLKEAFTGRERRAPERVVPKGDLTV